MNLFISVSTLCTCLTTISALSIEHENYLAPLVGMDIPDKVPNEYGVTFYNKHTLEEHFNAIGRNLLSLPGFHKFTFGYIAIMDETTRDEHVRRDPGVRGVEASVPVYAILSDDMEYVDPLQPLNN